MLLAIDIGNTNTVFALCDESATRYQWRIRTEAQRTADEYAVWLFTLMKEFECTRSDIHGVIVSSVVPEANFTIGQFAKTYLGQEAIMVTNGLIDGGMKVCIDNPRELGADRLINAIAAWETYKQALIIVDFGTATTFDVVSGAGDYMGGIIAPGINLSLDALQRAATKLHGIAIKAPQKVVGTNTTGAMQSGIYFGYAGLIEGIVARIKEERAETMKVIATGGLATLYAGATRAIDAVDSDLTIRGLRLMYKRATR
jgi:type III pantothenate kinase